MFNGGSMRYLNLLPACAALFCAGCLASPKPVARAMPEECVRPLNADLAAWNFDSAIARVNRCIKQRRADLEELRKAAADEGAMLGAKSAIAHLLCVKVQAQALKGALNEARETLKFAELYNRTYPEAGMSLAVNNSMLPVTRAFLLEKSGDLKGAAAAYREIAAATKAAGFISYPDLVCGRLAVIAFESGDEKGAARWSGQTASFDSGAKAVQGAMLQRKGDEAGARDKYEETLKLLDLAAKSGDVVQPVYFAEEQRVKDGLAEVVALLYK